jgi:hypothetical protein
MTLGQEERVEGVAEKGFQGEAEINPQNKLGWQIEVNLKRRAQAVS